MAERSNISWTDATWNAWRGCSKVSPGCAQCYAEKLVTTRLGGAWGPGQPRVRAAKSTFTAPLAWNKRPWVCDACGTPRTEPFELGGYCQQRDGDGVMCHTGKFHRRRVFFGSLMDWLDPEVPAEWLADALDIVRRCDELHFITCTKRPELWQARIECARHAIDANDSGNTPAWITAWLDGNAPNNITILASIENQEMAEKRTPELLRIPAATRGLSCEPLLGPVNVEPFLLSEYDKRCFDSQLIVSLDTCESKVGWVIVGGESGLGARPCNVAWIRSLVEQCAEWGVPCFVKQLGAHCVTDECTPDGWPPGTQCGPWQPAPLYARVKLRDPKGADPAEWPADLRVQEFPPDDIFNTKEFPCVTQ